VSPALRLSFSLVASLLLWVPTVPGAIAAHEDPARIALSYLLALVVSLVGVGLVFRIISAYAAAHEAAAHAQAEAAAQATLDAAQATASEEATFGRRRDDHGQQATEETLLDEALDEVEQTTALAS
jgi:hypothetical protein